MRILFVLIISLTSLTNSWAQTQFSSKKIGIFAPLYLDSVFKSPAYKNNKKFPRFALPAIDFVQGAKKLMEREGLSNKQTSQKQNTSKEGTNGSGSSLCCQRTQ